MRLASNDTDGGVVIDGNGVYTEDPRIPEVERRPLVSEMPEVAVIPHTPEVPDALEVIRGRVLIISNVPGAPAPARSGFGREPEERYDN